jgi:hypothetical protein
MLVAFVLIIDCVLTYVAEYGDGTVIAGYAIAYETSIIFRPDVVNVMIEDTVPVRVIEKLSAPIIMVASVNKFPVVK